LFTVGAHVLILLCDIRNYRANRTQITRIFMLKCLIISSSSCCNCER